jgi:uncharacterized membrane protein
MAEAKTGARLLATGTPENRPAWLRPTPGETRWWVGLSFLVMIVIGLLLPSPLVLHPAAVFPSIEGALLLMILFTHPDRMSKRQWQHRLTAVILLAVVAVANAISLLLLIHDIVDKSGVGSRVLLGGGAGIWITNALVFGHLFWELDRGGPADRANAVNTRTDLLFPQMTDEELAHDWEPIFFDYQYVSFTNSTAFSPTDTMPLTRRMKALFAGQSMISLITVGLIIARAVNILPS